MKQQLHRSLIFWSGILIMAFIGWAWRDSMQRSSSMGHGTWDLVSSHAGLQFFPSSGDAVAWRFVSRPTNSYPLRVAPQWLPAPHAALSGKTNPEEVSHKVRVTEFASLRQLHDYWLSIRSDMQVYFLPYWLILLAVAFPWLGLLLWRARRRKRAHAITP